MPAGSLWHTVDVFYVLALAVNLQLTPLGLVSSYNSGENGRAIWGKWGGGVAKKEIVKEL